MITLTRATSDNTDFQMLVKQLDSDLKIRDGDDHPFYDQFNKIDSIKHTVIAYENEQPVGCGAIKQYEEGTMEVKRMFVPPTYRGKGIATQILIELERWASELSFNICVLNTLILPVVGNDFVAVFRVKSNGFRLFFTCFENTFFE